MKTYGQYCPISRSAELLGDRWTIHIVRDLLTGTTRFNEFISGNPVFPARCSADGSSN